MSHFEPAATVALVTGSNRGIGRSIAIALLDSGVSRVYLAARDPKSVTDLVETYGKRAIALPLDVTRDDQVAAAARTANDVTLLINNAGVAHMAGGLDADTVEIARREMDVNYLGVLRMVGAFAPVLKRNGGGTVVNIASIVSFINFPLFTTYSASKAAALSLSYGLRPTLAAQQARLITVHPGPIDTDMAKDLEMDKVPPRVVADQLLAALRDESVEAVFPDPMAQQLYSQWLSDPIGTQREQAAAPAA